MGKYYVEKLFSWGWNFWTVTSFLHVYFRQRTATYRPSKSYCGDYHCRKYRQTSNIRRTFVGYNCWSRRCSCSIACRRCSNCIFILDLVSMDWAKTTSGRDTKRLSFGNSRVLYWRFDGSFTFPCCPRLLLTNPCNESEFEDSWVLQISNWPRTLLHETSWCCKITHFHKSVDPHWTHKCITGKGFIICLLWRKS